MDQFIFCAIICILVSDFVALDASDIESMKSSTRSDDPKTRLAIPYFHIRGKAYGAGESYIPLHIHTNHRTSSATKWKKPLRMADAAQRPHRPSAHHSKQNPTSQAKKARQNAKMYVKRKQYMKPKWMRHEDESESYQRGTASHNDDTEFVPTRMFAQVRHFEKESHMPADVHEPRLRKIVKDTRIHTVYNEEGYEDGAYDHAGEEKNVEENSSHEERHRRRRQLDVAIDTDFIAKHQFALGRENEGVDEEKYPYYRNATKAVHPNSPLRYAQNLDAVPAKRVRAMAFYEQATNATKCDNIATDVDPVPKELDDEEGPRTPNVPQTRRLPKLNDKFDCYKAQLFGKVPFDNPLFMEESISAPDDLHSEVQAIIDQIKVPDSSRIPKQLHIPSEAAEALPEAEALKRRRKVERKKSPLTWRYPHHAQSTEAFYTRQPIPQSTLSEIYYKNQIQPKEQLNVFVDVINHIQNMSQAETANGPHSEITQFPARMYRKPAKRKIPSNRNKHAHPVFYDHSRRSKTKPAKHRHDVRPIYLPVMNEKVGLDTNSATQYTTIDIPLNKFIVPGMKPPLLLERPFIYSELQNDFLQRGNWLVNQRSSRRKRAVKSYSNIRRQPPQTAMPSAEEAVEDNDDDYVPHRSTNYHYDPETRRIVYVNQPTTEPSVEHIISEYFDERSQDKEEEEEDDPHQHVPTSTEVTAKPKIPQFSVYEKDANGKTLVDYIMELKSHPSYVPIADPEKTKGKAKETTTTEILPPTSTTPPQISLLLHNLHSDNKRIDDEFTADQKKTKTSTEQTIVIEQHDEQLQDGSTQATEDDIKLGIFDINAYLPQVKTYTPRTTIDFAKYKTIERTHSRHNLSSRYNEDSTEAPSDEDVPLPSTSAPNTSTMVATTMVAGTDSTKPPTKLLRTRGTRRPTRTFTTSPSLRSTSEAIHTAGSHRPVSRVYPRRNRTRILLRPTTTTTTEVTPDEAAETVISSRWSRGSHFASKSLPSNHKPHYTPLRMSKRVDDNDPIMVVQRKPRLVTPDIIRYNRTSLSDVHGKMDISYFGNAENSTQLKFIKDPSKRLYFYAPL